MFERVLVTGGGGAVGSTIVDHLVRAGASEVIVADSFARGRPANLEWALQNGPVRLLAIDIRDRAAVEAAMVDVDVVFHKAALRVTRGAEHTRRAARGARPLDGSHRRRPRAAHRR